MRIEVQSVRSKKKERKKRNRRRTCRRTNFIEVFVELTKAAADADDPSFLQLPGAYDRPSDSRLSVLCGAAPSGVEGEGKAAAKASEASSSKEAKEAGDNEEEEELSPPQFSGA